MRFGEEKKKKEEEIMSASATQGGYKKPQGQNIMACAIT